MRVGYSPLYIYYELLTVVNFYKQLTCQNDSFLDQKALQPQFSTLVGVSIEDMEMDDLVYLKRSYSSS